ncbi:MAG: ABC transporter permease [Candidatus Acidiferrales bacterium]
MPTKRPTRSSSEIREAVALAFDALRRNPMRSFLTILGIVIGVSSIIAVGSVINGLNSNVIGSIEDIGSNIVIVYRFSWATLGRLPGSVLQRKEMKPEWAEGMARLAHVEAVAPSLRIFNPQFGAGFTNIQRGKIRVSNVIIQGNPPSVQQIFNIDLQAGRWFNQVDEDHRSPVCVLGYDTAASLFPNPGENPIGKQVLVEGKVFTVVGVASHRRQAFGSGANPEDNQVIMPLSTMEKVHPEYHDFVLFVKADDAKNVPAVVDELDEFMRRQRRLTPKEADDFDIFTPDAFIDLWKEISSGIFVLMFAVGSVALLVGGIGVMNIMLVSVTERTREIGVRKAIGAKRKNILWQFLFEAVALTGIGGAIGVAIGAALGLAVRLIFPSLPATITLLWVVLGIGAAATVGIGFGIYPAWKAARLDPVEALRYE